MPATAKTQQGKPCRACKGTDRYVSSNLCTACARKRYHDKRKQLDGTEFVYQCFDEAGELIYVGRTNNPGNRISTHKQETAWWGEVRRMTWIQVPDVERQLIIQLKPRYNKHGNSG